LPISSKASFLRVSRASFVYGPLTRATGEAEKGGDRRYAPVPREHHKNVEGLTEQAIAGAHMKDEG
jgi:hypothetical protein